MRQEERIAHLEAARAASHEHEQNLLWEQVVETLLDAPGRANRCALGCASAMSSPTVCTGADFCARYRQCHA